MNNSPLVRLLEEIKAKHAKNGFGDCSTCLILARTHLRRQAWPCETGQLVITLEASLTEALAEARSLFIEDAESRVRRDHLVFILGQDGKRER